MANCCRWWTWMCFADAPVVVSVLAQSRKAQLGSHTTGCIQFQLLCLGGSSPTLTCRSCSWGGDRSFGRWLVVGSGWARNVEYWWWRGFGARGDGLDDGACGNGPYEVTTSDILITSLLRLSLTETTLLHQICYQNLKLENTLLYENHALTSTIDKKKNLYINCKTFTNNVIKWYCRI